MTPFYTARVGGELEVWLEGEVYRFRAEEGPAPPTARSASLARSGEVRSPMPGLVLKVLVQAGAEVAAQDPLVVIESMKMELTVTAPAPGRVSEVLYDVGGRVDRVVEVARPPQAMDQIRRRAPPTTPPPSCWRTSSTCCGARRTPTAMAPAAICRAS